VKNRNSELFTGTSFFDRTVAKWDKRFIPEDKSQEEKSHEEKYPEEKYPEDLSSGINPHPHYAHTYSLR